ncbi:helix-turn-helix transcriptional regulator [Chryseobacterium oryctis]|uniref:Helix-turn-helix transcriptional regulator n=1 Tax=Chryseobacterium oryctis TaxID=2952618 RepID=A0ABT3HS11_9FLAO|nr:helix-turn-helix transcriptional regulator [Chryseobacterium oryctis]MCW3162475.1 helix-turn-helix transcriptional regulator [Chryseobacterium oryctis]
MAKAEYQSNPENAIVLAKQANAISKQIKYSKGMLQSNKILMKLFHDKGEEEKSLFHSNEMINIAKQLNDNNSLAEAHIERGRIFSALGLYEKQKIEIEESIRYIQLERNINKQHYNLSLAYQNLATDYYQKIKAPQDSVMTYLTKSLEEVNKIKDNNDGVDTDSKYDMISYLHMNIGMFYISIHQPQRLDLAQQHLEKSLAIVDNHHFAKLKVDRIPILTTLARFHEISGKYEEAITKAEEILTIEKKQKSPFDRLLAFRILSNSYEGLNRQDSLVKYLNLYTKLSDSLNYARTKQANTTLKNIEQETKSSHERDKKSIILVSAGLILLLIFGIWIYWKNYRKKYHKRYLNIIERLKQRRSFQTNFSSIEKNQEKVNTIPNDTLNSILNKLEKFENSERFTKKNISLTYLANSFSTNTRTLSEVIKQHKGKSFNGYLNSLRIEYITRKLYEDPIFREYKISYLAEACGFSSREVFANIFKKETGVTPSYFIEQIKADNINDILSIKETEN